MAAKKKSLKSDFEFFVSDNGLSNILAVDPELIDNKFGFTTELSITFSLRANNLSAHGKPKNGTPCENLTKAERAAEAEVEQASRRELDKVSKGSSDFLRMKSGSQTLTSGNYYVVSECKQCASTGKISCVTCNAKGKSDCQNCSRSGSLTCHHCNGFGKHRCSSCNGAGSHLEFHNSDDDGYLDSLGKQYGMPKHRKCSYCYNGYNTCTVCNGRKKIICSACTGEGVITCRRCKGARKVSCTNCSGHGCNSEIISKTAELKSDHRLSNFSKLDTLVKNCIKNSYDDFFSGAHFSNISESNKAKQGQKSWSLIAQSRYEILSIISEANGDFKVARLSENNENFASTVNLDEALLNVASNALSGINTLGEFKEKAPNLPGVLRWAFGEKVKSPNHAKIRPMYEGLLSEGGKAAILSLKSDYLNRVASSLKWKFMLITVPVSIGILIALIEFFYQSSSPNYFSLTAYIVAALVFAYGLADFFSDFYSAYISKL